MFFSFAWYASKNGEQRLSDTDRVFDLWWAAFQQQYRQGGYLNVCLHPFVSGRALRVAMLDRLIARMKTLPGVWFATCEEIAQAWEDDYEDRRLMALPDARGVAEMPEDYNWPGKKQVSY